MSFEQLNKKEVTAIIRQALREDIGIGDITSDCLFSRYDKVKAIIISKCDGILAGQDIAELIFSLIDPSVCYKTNAADGDVLSDDKVIAYVDGSVKSILKAERTVLNFLAKLSGISTCAHEYVKVLGKYNVKLRDTRKTTPGLRALEKYAVRVAGGLNHRMGLYDAILIKDNHIVSFNKLRKGTSKNLISNIISIVDKKKLKNVEVELEVTNLDQFKQALELGVDIVMLDNMTVNEIEQAVAIKNKKGYESLIEVSGGVTLANIEDIASKKPDYISVGAITHSSKALDLSLEVI